jgi:hypothetical protein
VPAPGALGGGGGGGDHGESGAAPQWAAWRALAGAAGGLPLGGGLDGGLLLLDGPAQACDARASVQLLGDGGGSRLSGAPGCSFDTPAVRRALAACAALAAEAWCQSALRKEMRRQRAGNSSQVVEPASAGAVDGAALEASLARAVCRAAWADAPLATALAEAVADGSARAAWGAGGPAACQALLGGGCAGGVFGALYGAADVSAVQGAGRTRRPMTRPAGPRQRSQRRRGLAGAFPRAPTAAAPQPPPLPLPPRPWLRHAGIRPWRRWWQWYARKPRPPSPPSKNARKRRCWGRRTRFRRLPVRLGRPRAPPAAAVAAG